MKIYSIILFLLGVSFSSCVDQNKTTLQINRIAERVGVTLKQDAIEKVEIPKKEIKKSALYYNPQISIWNYNETPYSGYVVSYYPNGKLKEKFGLMCGKKQNEANNWYPDGHLKYSSTYHNGKLHGEKIIWSSEVPHILIAHFNYYLGKANGEQKKWYPTVEIYKKLNLNMGKEEGIQQAFRKNGKLYVNYEAVKGRIFGLKKAALCYKLEDQIIKMN